MNFFQILPFLYQSMFIFILAQLVTVSWTWHLQLRLLVFLHSVPIYRYFFSLIKSPKFHDADEILTSLHRFFKSLSSIDQRNLRNSVNIPLYCTQEKVDSQKGQLDRSKSVIWASSLNFLFITSCYLSSLFKEIVVFRLIYLSGD